jgi:hypothetical protein
MTADIKRQFRRMTGEAMREIGVLLFVFAPLDSFFSREQLTVGGIIAIVVVSVLFHVMGMLMGLEHA